MPRKLPRRPDKNERTAIAGKMRAAFDTLADEKGHGFAYSGLNPPDKGRKLLRDFGESIQKLLDPATADQQAAADRHIEVCETLQQLLDGRATALDLADFMYHCTRGVPTTTIGYLEDAGFSKDKLRKMAHACNELAESFETLNLEAVPGPLAYLFYIGKLSPDHKTLTAFRLLPENLRICAGVLEEWPPKDYTSSLTERQFGNRFLLAYFWVYILFCGGKFADLSALLRLMRSAWFDLFPLASTVASRSTRPALQRYPFLKLAEREKGDPLSARALNRAIDRFFALNRSTFLPVLTHVDQYLKEPKYKELRKKNQTFMSLIGDF